MFNRGIYFFMLCCLGINSIQATKIDEGQPEISQHCATCKSSFEEALKDLAQDMDFDQFFRKAKQCISQAKTGDLNENKDTEDVIEIASMEDRLNVIRRAFDYSRSKATPDANENESMKKELESMGKELTETLGWYGEDVDTVIRNVLPPEQEVSLPE